MKSYLLTKIFLILICITIASCDTVKVPTIDSNSITEYVCSGHELKNHNTNNCDCNELPDKSNKSDSKAIKNWHDRFGKEYCSIILQDPCKINNENKLRTAPAFGSPDYQSSGGCFNLYYRGIQLGQTTGFGSSSNINHINIINQVFSDLNELIECQNSNCGYANSPVNFEIISINDPLTNVLGAASSYYFNAGETQGIKHNEVWNAINGGANDPNEWDGYIILNLGYNNWYTGFNGSTPSGQIDLYSVILHEVLHTLGFASLINSSGNSKYQPSGGTPTFNNYSIFDESLQFENTGILNNQNLISNSSGYINAFNGTSNPSTDLIAGCQNPSPNGPDIKFELTTGASFPIYAPAGFSNGSSLSHFNIACDGVSTSDFVMHPSLGAGVSRRISQEEIFTLCEIGYKTSSSFGTPSLISNGNINPNLSTFTPCGQVFAAVTDYGPCCTSNDFKVEYCDGASLIIDPSDLICNDNYSGSVSIIDFEYINSGLPLMASGTNYEYFPTQLGYEVLRYRLEDSNGTLSNYAYVIILNNICTQFDCPNNSICNLICNPELLYDPTNCTFTGCGFSGYSSNSICIDGWRFMYGTPDPTTDAACQLPISPGGGMHIGSRSLQPDVLDGVVPGEMGEGTVTPTAVFEWGEIFIFRIL